MRILLPIFFAALLMSATTDAQLPSRNPLEKAFAPADIQQALVSPQAWMPFPKSPAAWEKILPDSVRTKFVNDGLICLKEPFPNVPASVTLEFFRNGNRTRYENIVFGKRNRLWNLVLAESVEGRGRFLDAILDGIWSICEESFWGASAHLFLQKGGNGLPDAENPVVDLFAAETAANLAWADYFVGSELDSISPLIRRRMHDEVDRRIFIPMQTAKYDWMGAGNKEAKLNNWAPWIMSNYLTAALLLEKDESKRAKYVYQAMQLTDQYINGLGEDGACEEGPTYWAGGPGCVLDVLDLLKSASNGRIDIFHENIVRNMAAYIYKVHIGDNYFVNVGDAHPEMTPEPVMIRRFGRETGDTIMRNFGAWLYDIDNYVNDLNHQMFHRTRELFDFNEVHELGAGLSSNAGHGLSAGQALGGSNAPFVDVADAWLPDVQIMVSRLAHGLFVAAHGSNNGKSHNHNDVGDFVVYADGEPVIIDVGSGTYTARTFSKDRYRLWFNTSPYHNLPTINGQEQREGLSFAATQVSYQTDRDKTVLRMNLEKAYPPAAGVSVWKRSIIAEKAGRVVIVDSCIADKSFSELTQSFMTVCSADISVPGLIVFQTEGGKRTEHVKKTEHGKKTELRYDAKTWQIQKEAINLITPEEEGIKTNWRGRTITRIRLTLRSAVRSAVFRYTIVAK
jgi:hypothetical protein